VPSCYNYILEFFLGSKSGKLETKCVRFFMRRYDDYSELNFR